MKNYFRIVLVVFLSAVIISCHSSTESDKDNAQTEPLIKQGVWGFVKFWEGDFMPMMPPGSSSGTITGVEKQIFVFELTSNNKAEAYNYGGFYTKINTAFIKTTASNSKGFFEIALPEGKYSLFVKENSMYYANSSDGDGNISSFIVKKDSLTRIEFNITYKATY